MHLPYLHSNTGMSSHGFVSSPLFRKVKYLMLETVRMSWSKKMAMDSSREGWRRSCSRNSPWFFVGKSFGAIGDFSTFFNKELNIWGGTSWIIEVYWGFWDVKMNHQRLVGAVLSEVVALLDLLDQRAFGRKNVPADVPWNPDLPRNNVRQPPQFCGLSFCSYDDIIWH